MKYEYCANCYVSAGGVKFTPGEIIDVEIGDRELERLIRLKAVSLVSVTEEEAVQAVTEAEQPEEAETVAEEEAEVMMPADIEIDITEGIVEESPKKKGGRKK